MYEYVPKQDIYDVIYTKRKGARNTYMHGAAELPKYYKERLI